MIHLISGNYNKYNVSTIAIEPSDENWLYFMTEPIFTPNEDKSGNYKTKFYTKHTIPPEPEPEPEPLAPVMTDITISEVSQEESYQVDLNN